MSRNLLIYLLNGRGDADAIEPIGAISLDELALGPVIGEASLLRLVRLPHVLLERFRALPVRLETPVVPLRLGRGPETL